MPPVVRWMSRLGPTNPIAVRLVQNGSRRARHLYIRSGYLAVLILVLLWLLLPSSGGALSYRALAQAGAQAFEWAAYVQIGLICVLAPVFMAGAIAQEASPRTWEVLLTTPLSAMQIVLGNLLGRLFFILALLLSSLPLFALTQYFGGVPWQSIFASYLIAGCAAVLVGAVAIALSVSRLVGNRAVFAFYIAVVSFLAVTIAVDALLRGQGLGSGPGGRGVTWMTAINPFLSLRSLLNPSGYPRGDGVGGVGAWVLANPVTAWCAGSGVLSAVLVVGSAVTVRSGGLGGLSRGAPGRVAWYRRLMGLGAAGSEHRPPRAVWQNPVAWREAAARNATPARIAARWLFIAAGVVWAVVLLVLYHGGRLSPVEFQLALLSTVMAEMVVATLVAVNMSSTAVTREREDGTLDLLLTTPITPGQYMSGKLRGLVAYLLPMLAVPVVTLGLAGAYTMSGGFGLSGAASAVRSVPAVLPTVMTPLEVPLVLPEGGILLAVVLLPFIAFVAMVGLHWSLSSKGTLTSVVWTVGVVGVVSGVVGLCAWQSGVGVPVLGPVMSGLSPASLVLAAVHPAEAMRDTVAREGGLTSARLSLAVGCVVSGLIYLTLVYGLHANMVRTFDVTVRKLAGTK